MIPSSRSMLNRDKRLPLDTWNQPGIRKTFLDINFLWLIHPEIILKEFNLTMCRETEKQSQKPEGRGPLTQVKTDKIKAQFQCRHLQEGRWLRVQQYRWNYRRTTWSDSKDSKYRNCKCDKFRHPQSILVWKIRFKNQVTTCSDFPSDAMLWIWKVEMVDPVKEWKSSRSVSGQNFPTILRWWRTIETVLRTIISVYQLSIYGAVSDLFEECKTGHVRTGKPVLVGQSDPLFVPTSSLMKAPTPSTEDPAQEDLSQ